MKDDPARAPGPNRASLTLCELYDRALPEVYGKFHVVAGPVAATPQRATLDGVWPALHYRDALGATRFAVDVLGFDEALVVADEADPSVIHHSELRWPEAAMVQIATSDREGNIYSCQRGIGTLYVITLDPDAFTKVRLSTLVTTVGDASMGGQATFSMSAV